MPPPKGARTGNDFLEATDADMLVDSELDARGMGSSPTRSDRSSMKRNSTLVRAASRMSFGDTSVPGAVPGYGVDKTPRRAKFEVMETGRKAEVLFVPAGVRMAPAAVAELATKTWKLSSPNLMVQCDAGAVHPAEFVSADLADLPAFESLLSQAREQVAASANRDQNSKWAAQYEADGVAIAMPTQQESEARALHIVNNLLWTKLVTIFTSVIDSAALSNNWIVVDRTTSMSAAAELALEAA
jgi:hypothetical protein